MLRSDPSLPDFQSNSTAEAVQLALEEMRTKLLDFTKRNPLINFKPSQAKAVRFVGAPLGHCFAQLVADERGLPVLPISPGAPEPDGTELSVEERASQLGISTSFDLVAPEGTAPKSKSASKRDVTLTALHYPEQLAGRLRRISNDSRTLLEETGANTLHLVFGLLEHYDAEGSKTPYYAPLICVPVRLCTPKQGHIELQPTGEDAYSNPVLLEHTRRQFGIELPEWQPDAGLSLHAYLDEIRGRVAGLRRWKVHHSLTLGLLSFTNMLLVRDLRPENWTNGAGGVASALETHPLVRQVLAGFESGEPLSPREESSGSSILDIELPLVFDSDGSQARALRDVLEGRSLVIEGPPGTGKSQTITNLLAAAMAKGLKVLFVAEKAAALGVVKSRLTQAGLGQLALELHGNKVNAYEVLQSVKESLDLVDTHTSARSPDKVDLLKDYASRLRKYADLLNFPQERMLGVSLHELVWQAEAHRVACADSAGAVENLVYPFAGTLSERQKSDLVAELKEFQEHYRRVEGFRPDHGLQGLRPAKVSQADTSHFTSFVRMYLEKFESMAAGARRLQELCSDFSETQSPVASAAYAAPARALQRTAERLPVTLLKNLFPATDPTGRHASVVLRALDRELVQYGELTSQLTECFGAVYPEAGQWGLAALQAWNRPRILQRQLKDVEPAASALVQSCDAGLRALAALHTCATAAEIEFEVTGEALHNLASLAEHLSELNFALLDLRHPGLSTPNALRILETAAQQRAHLAQQEQQLSALFHLDIAPEVEDLKAAARVLRTAGLFSALSKEYRAAKQLHTSLCKTRGDKSATERADDLQQIQAFVQAKLDWNTTTLARVAGPHFNGFETDFDGLCACLAWCQTATRLLNAADLSGLFDITQVPTIELKSFGALCAAARTLKLKTAYVQACAEAVGIDFDVTASTMVQAALHTAHRDALTLRELALSFASRHVAETEFGVALQAEQNLLRVPTLRASISNNMAARNILGDDFQGVKTDIKRILAVLQFGYEIQHSPLPTSLQAALLRHSTQAMFTAVADAATELETGLSDWNTFCRELERLGEFSAIEWVGLPHAVTDAVQWTSALVRKTARALDASTQLGALSQYLAVRRKLGEKGLTPFIQRVDDQSLKPEHLVDAVLWRLLASMAAAVIKAEPCLEEFSGVSHRQLQGLFADLDRDLIKARGEHILANHFAALNDDVDTRLPNGTDGAKVAEKTETALLRHCVGQSKPRVKLRKLLSATRTSLQSLKPCFMMSPQAVAKYLVPGEIKFDLVVMDEASQMRPEEAIGAIARGKQLVVVGDSKQLPPTSFFSAVTGDDAGAEENVTAGNDAESILDLCKGHFRRSHTLRWHYRSRHESLIAFSNLHFYDNKLLVFPSPSAKSEGLGLRYVHVAEGVYKGQANIPEGERVVQEALRHMHDRPFDSLGIVTLNQRQAELIEDRLFQAMQSSRGAEKFRAYHEQAGSPLFVKNLEAVQGDERDCIFISTTFGRPEGAASVAQNFGPVSRSTGWRRLNVLVTRAKKSTAVFSSMLPEDIRVNATTPLGTKALRDYLAYARSGVLMSDKGSLGGAESPFEAAVGDLLRKHNYVVVPQLGVSTFRIDMAVKTAETDTDYLAAIECDGATYHSGFDVRDRDRIRQEILEGMGWKGKIYRIWSTDWFNDPRGESSRLLQFLTKLHKKSVSQRIQVPTPPAETGSPKLQSGNIESLTSTAVAVDAETTESHQSLITPQAPAQPSEDNIVSRNRKRGRR